MIQVYKFWASWCSPCTSYAPIFTKVRKELESNDIKFYEIDIDQQESKDMLSKFKVKSIPTTVVVEGENIKHISGKIEEDTLKEFIIDNKTK